MQIDSMKDKNNLLLVLTNSRLNGTFDQTWPRAQMISELIEKVKKAEIKADLKLAPSSGAGSKRKKMRKSR